MPSRNTSRSRPVAPSLYEFPQPVRVPEPERRVHIQNALPEIRRHLQTFVTAQSIPGLAFGLVADGVLLAEEYIGIQNVETRTRVTSDTAFRIASMSKSFAAMAILRLRDTKKLRLDDAAAKFIPELKPLAYPTLDSPEITVRHLLTMTSGFPEDNPWGDRQMAIDGLTFTKWLEAGIPFSNAPGIEFEYSNYGYAILGRIITRVAGIPFQRYIAQEILRPLGMNATGWDSRHVPAKNLALGYRYSKNLKTNKDLFIEEPMLDDGAFAAMAGLFTTVPDFGRYMLFLLDAFPARSDAESGPIKRATAREMQQLQRFEGIAEHKLESGTGWRAAFGYGFGLAVWHDDRLGYGVSHGGGLPGFGSYYYMLPHCGIALVALTNKTYSGVGRIFPQILDVLYQAGALTPKPIVPAPVLLELQAVVQAWFDGASDSELESHIADNFLLDQDIAHRRAERDALRKELGATLNVGSIQPLNALRGKWTVECERGSVELALTLAPTMPPLVQLVTMKALPSTTA